MNDPDPRDSIRDYGQELRDDFLGCLLVLLQTAILVCKFVTVGCLIHGCYRSYTEEWLYAIAMFMASIAFSQVARWPLTELAKRLKKRLGED